MPLALLILAQADAPPPDFGAWLANLMYLALTGAAIVGGLAAWKSYREPRSVMPDPLNVRTHIDFATKHDLSEVERMAHGRMSRERDEANAKIAAVAAENKELRKKLDDDIGELRDQLADNNTAGEARVNALRADMAEQTKLIISVIRKEGAGR